MCWMLKEPLISPVQEPQRIPGLYVWITHNAHCHTLPVETLAHDIINIINDCQLNTP